MDGMRAGAVTGFVCDGTCRYKRGTDRKGRCMGHACARRAGGGGAMHGPVYDSIDLLAAVCSHVAFPEWAQKRMGAGAGAFVSVRTEFVFCLYTVLLLSVKSGCDMDAQRGIQRSREDGNVS